MGNYEHPSVFLLRQTRQLQALMTVLRDENTKREDFVFCSDRILRLLVEDGLNLLPVKEKTIITPTKTEFTGTEFSGEVCCVSILRAGESMERVVRELCRKMRVGKILLQRDEKTLEPKFYYSKLPPDISKRYVLLLDPMLATGGSACAAIELLKQQGVAEEKIIFINLIACPQGIQVVLSKYPKVKIVTAAIDDALNDNAYIVPGLGDFGDRYLGT